MSDFTRIVQVNIPKSLVDEMQLFLRKVGATGREGMVLWRGFADGNLFSVTDILIPRQRGLNTEDGVCVVVDEDEMHEINVSLFQSGLRLIAQVHTHPTNAYHSETDDKYAIATTTGSLSLVIPNFAAGEFDITNCAAYRLDKGGGWIHVPPRQVKSLIVIGNT